ncbi:MAG TPA: arylesterase [Cytophagaceae bacterium]
MIGQQIKKFLSSAIILNVLIILLLSCQSQPERIRSENIETDTIADNADTSRHVKTIVFFGNSLTAGYGLDPQQSFPSLIQKKIDSLGLKYKVVNAGVSGETTAGGKSRVNWVLNQPVDIFVLELGANDGLRGLPLKETKQNLVDIIHTVKNKYPDAQIVLAGMQVPPNMGPEYAKQFSQLYQDIAREEQVHLISFLLEGVAGEPELNLDDRIHPNVEGQKIVADNVWDVLEKVLDK